MQSIWPGDAELIILDEIHKYKKWVFWHIWSFLGVPDEERNCVTQKSAKCLDNYIDTIYIVSIE